MKSYISILGIVDKLNDMNEKFNGFASEHLDSPFIGTVVVIGAFIIAAWGINALNKK